MNRQILKGVIIGGLFIIPFVPLFVSSALFFPFITSKAFAFRIIVEIVFAAWVLLAWKVPEYRPKKSWISWALLAFIVIIGLANIFGPAPVKSFWSNFERMEGFATLLHLGMLYLVISSTFKERLWHKWWQTTLGAAVIISVYCFFQLTGSIEIHQGGARVDGTLGNAAYLAVYMLFHIFFAFLLLLREKRKKMRWLYGSLALIFTTILYFTATRGAILGLLGGLLVAALLSITHRENKRVRTLAISYIALFVILVGGFFALRDTSFVQGNPVLSRFAVMDLAQIKTEGRSFVWPMAVEGIKERPILGWGQDNFNYVFNEHYSPQMFRLEPWFDRAHNIFLDWGIAGGLLGLFAYLSLYVLALFYIWKRMGFERGEKALLTGLLSAYFFHNFFVFDHLVSYILFISTLGFIHFRVTTPEVVREKNFVEKGAPTYALPLVGILLLAVLYFVNIAPIRANATLIEALRNVQTKNFDGAIDSFQEAYDKSRLGRPEVVEQVVSNAPAILNSEELTAEEKSEFLAFAKNVVEKQANDFSGDARYQILAGSFLARTGDTEGGLAYLEKARTLSPGKQSIYFEMASAFINQGDNDKALEVLKTAYEMAPEYNAAAEAYLVGAIRAGNRELENELLETLKDEAPEVLMAERVLNAYIAAGRFEVVIEILEEKVRLNPNDPQNYANLAGAYLKAGNRAMAIQTLRRLSTLHPQYESQVEEYIKGI